nr:immunoglobulin light chain junction region [Macaca mulatta]MOW66151.1 immunoglobulin light chain junction region [Macaca mulatta]MOW66431.1 immunoglobulin light chain junction region [Macaca mulatta]MOW66436.1 immunoglobulin light chain junction region [Macaca mulatta]MOW66509.1 immunoglobulin light chain junction region [Macaca mulatta]
DYFCSARDSSLSGPIF